MGEECVGADEGEDAGMSGLEELDGVEERFREMGEVLMSSPVLYMEVQRSSECVARGSVTWVKPVCTFRSIAWQSRAARGILTSRVARRNTRFVS